MQQRYECNKHLWLARLEDSDKSTTLVDTDGLQSVRTDRRRMTGDIVDVKAEWTGRSPSTRTRRGIITRQTRLDIDTQLTLIRCPWQNDMTLQVCSVHVSVAIQVVDGEGDERQQEVVDDIGLEPG